MKDEAGDSPPLPPGEVPSPRGGEGMLPDVFQRGCWYPHAMATQPPHSPVSMRRLLVTSIAALVAFTAGCSLPKDPPPDVVAPADGSLPATAVRQVEFEPPMPLRGGRYWLVPVAVQVDRE